MPITRNGQMLASLKRGTSQIAFVFQGTTQIWAHEIVVVLGASGAQTYLADLFDPTVWASSTPKRVVVPEGVERGASGSWVFAVVNGAQAASYGGTLTLENQGTISGRGGSANSGVGGDVISANVPGKDGQQLIINNHGTIRAGGGGGGLGGNGGPGYYQTPYTYQEGPYYQYGPSYYVWYEQGYLSVGWGSSHNNIYQGYHSGSSISVGGWTYYRGSYRYENSNPGNGQYGYEVYRQQTRYNTYYTSGGAGGAGGRGQGYDGANAGGSGGAAGGTNAGAGGTGGWGGGWGATGATGNTGASGNNGGGAAGAVGGLAGFYLTGQANAVLNNFGSVLGRLN